MIKTAAFPYKSELSVQRIWENVQNIYAHITDEKSKDIYTNRLLLSLTGDVKYIRELVLSTDLGLKFKKYLNEQEMIYIYGAGIRGKRLVQMFPEMKWEKYIDRNCEGVCNGIDIIKPNDLRLEKNAVVLITNYEGFEEIRQDLNLLGIDNKQIVCMNDFEKEAQNNQYFEERCVKFFRNTSGYFIDAGCFDGRDCIRFIESDFNNNTQVYAFEPDSANYKMCGRALSGYENVHIYNLGLSDSKKEEKFLSDQGEKARVSIKGDCLVKLDMLDNVMNDKPIGFIKMDIEGNEKAALIGTKIHIQQDKPNMMISIYHKIEDIVEIPKLLLDINPKYKFAFGHYSIGSASETVIYVFE